MGLFVMEVTRIEAAKLGLPRYFTGEPCKKGHISKRVTLTGHCMECDRERRRIYIKSNPHKIRAQNLRYAEKIKKLLTTV